MITKQGLNIAFCCGFMMDKVLTNRIQVIEAGNGRLWLYAGPMEGWDDKHLQRCPSFKYCPYCGRIINSEEEEEE